LIIWMEATTRIELVYTVLQPYQHGFRGVPESVKPPISLLNY
jgi:hypothetical protein